jgi:hypothetical protein
MSTELPPRASYGIVTCLSIFVGDKRFDLTAEELATEPNNIFNEIKRVSFLACRTPSLNADAHLFRLIHAHLQGYEIFPLPEGGTPFGRGAMNEVFVMLGREATMHNLWRDARDFGLDNLVMKIEREMERLGLEPKRPSHLDLTGAL